MLVVLVGTCFGGIYWRYARGPVGYELLPTLGFLLAFAAIFARGSSTALRIIIGIVAAIAVLYGFIAPILEPAY
jgi:hypothetical protein